MNYVHLSGFLGANPEGFGTPENPSTKVSLATTRVYYQNEQKKEETTWHTIFFSGKSAENVLRFFKSGQQMVVTGRLRSNKYKDKQGVERTGYFVQGIEWDFGKDGKNSTANVTQTPTATVQAPTQVAQTANAEPARTPAPVQAKKPLAATVSSVTHTEEDLAGFADVDPTMDDLPF